MIPDRPTRPLRRLEARRRSAKGGILLTSFQFPDEGSKCSELQNPQQGPRVAYFCLRVPGGFGIRVLRARHNKRDH